MVNVNQAGRSFFTVNGLVGSFRMPAVRRSVRNSAIGLMLAGTALSSVSPAAAATTNLGGGAVTVTTLPSTGYSNGTLTVNPAAGGVVFGGNFDDSLGVFALTKGGTRTLTLTGSGNNTYSGNTRVTGGLLAAGAANVLSPNSQMELAGGLLDLGGFNQTIRGLKGVAAADVFNSGAGQAVLTIDVPVSATYAGSISGNIRVVKTGAGTQNFQRASTFTGGVQLDQGTLRFGDDLSFGTGAITVGSGGGALDPSNIGRSLANDLVLVGSVTISAPLTLTGTVSGAGQIIKTGNNYLTLTNAANTTGGTPFTGGIQINGGGILARTDSLGTGAITTGPGQVVLGTDGDRTVRLDNNIGIGGQLNVQLPNGANTLTLNGVISDASAAGRLYLKSGTGTLVLNGANTYSGDTLATTGVVGVGNNKALGTGIVRLSGTSGVAAYASNVVIANTLRVGLPVVVDTRGETLTFSGPITDLNPTTAGGIVKQGAGTLKLTGAGTYTGGTTINTGDLVLNGSILGNVDINAGTILGGTGSVLGTGLVTANAGGNISPGDSGIGTLTLSNLTLLGGSFLNFDLAAAPTVGGGVNDLIIVSNNVQLGGSLNVTNAGGFGIGTYRLINYGGSLLGGTLAINTIPAGYAYSIDTSIGGQVNLVVSALAPPTTQFYWDGSGAPNNGNVAGGSGTWNTSNTNWTDSGGAVNAVWPNLVTTEGFFTVVGGAVTVATTQNFGTLHFTVTGYQLSGADLNTAAGTIDAQVGTTTIDSNITGVGGLTKTGAGALVLNGTNNYGDTNLAEGTLVVGNGSAIGAGLLTMQTDTTLAAGANGIVLTNLITTVGNGIVNSGPGIFTLDSDIDGPGSISKIGTGNLVLNGNNSFTNLGINQGTVTVGKDTSAGIGAIAINDNATLAAGVTGLVLTNAIQTTANGLVDSGPGIFTLDGDIAGPGSISKIGSGNLVLNGDNSFTNLGINQGTVTVGTNTAAGNGAIAINNNATLAAGANGLVLTNAIQTTANGLVNSGPGIFTLDGSIAGPGSISKIGSGNLVLNGNNSFTNLGINQGTVTVGTNTAAGNGAIAINNNATLAAGVTGLVLANAIQTTANGLVDSSTGIFTLDGSIAGPGSISKIGAGTLVLNGNNSFTNLGINQGTVQVGSNTAAGSGAIAINNNATLQSGGAAIALANGVQTTANGLVNVRAGEVLTLDGNVAGPGSISQVGPGTLVLNGNNSFTNLGINQGTVRVGSNTAGGNGSIAINNNATLQSGGAAVTLANAVQTTANGLVDARAGEVLTLNGNVAGPGSISQIGAGTLVLNGNNSFTNLGINQGTVRVGSDTAAGIGAVAINNNATLQSGAAAVTLANAVQTTANGLIDVRTGEVLTLNGDVTGAGSISQVGPGTLVLNGNNSFTNLGINQGTVQVGSNTAAGIGGIAINNNATLQSGGAAITLANQVATTANGLVNVRTGEVLTLNGNVTGAGSISQVGPGTLVLNGNNSFVNLGINQGTVQVGSNTAAGSANLAINNNATLQSGGAAITLANAVQTTANGLVNVRAGEVLTLNGNVTGAGSISQVGPGTLVLNGNNSFVNLGINQGTVQVGSNTAAGSANLAINNNATLQSGGAAITLANAVQTTANGLVNVRAGEVLTLNGNVTGAGSISQVGPGTLVLNGNNSFKNLGINQGTVQVGSNTAAGSGGIAINNNATLSSVVAGVNIANGIITTGNGYVSSTVDSFTLSGAINGAGGLTKTGSGVVNLTAASLYTGPTSVAAGRLNVTGSTVSATTVQSGGTLSGTGRVGSLTVLSGGTVSPGTSAGMASTLTVNGALVLAAGSTYIVDGSPMGADRITATGTSNIAGNIVINATGSPFAFGDTVILSSSARTGTFANSSINGLFGPVITANLTYTATSVLLSLAPKSLVNDGGVTLTGNPLAVATAFDTAVRNGYNPTPFYPLFTQGANLPNALSQLSGELHSAERRVLLEDTRVVREAAFDRLNAGLAASSGAQTATTESGDKTVTMWLRGAGSWGTAKADAIGSRFETKQIGVLTGIDVAMGGAKIGAMFHYTQTDIDFATLGTSKVKSTGGAIYAGYRQPGAGFAVGLGGSYAGTKAEGGRTITIPGLGQTLNSKIDGSVYQVFAEIAYDLIPGEAVRVEPFGRVAYAQLKSKPFAETGGIAALVGGGQNNELRVFDLGLRGAVALDRIELTGSAAWHRASGDLDGLTFTSITGLNSQAGIRTVALDRDAVAIEAQAAFRITDTIKIGAGYSGVIGSKNQDHGARATLTVGF